MVVKNTSPHIKNEMHAIDSPEFNSLLFESSPDCVKLLDTAGHILAMNRNGQCTMEIDDFFQILNVPWVSLWPEHSHRKIMVALDAARKGRAGRFDAFCPTAKGTPKWWDVIVTPIHTADGRIERLMSVSRDVTAAYWANEEVQASRELFALLLESSGEGIYGMGPDNRCTFINRTGAAILGYEPNELIGEELHHLIHHHRADGSAYPGEECRLVKAVAKGTEARIEDEVFWHKNGTLVAVSYSVAPMVKDGVHNGAVVTFTDITKRRQTEKALQANEARLRLATDAAQLGLWTWNQDSDEIKWENDRSQQILGLPLSYKAFSTAEFFSIFPHSDDVIAFKQSFVALDAGERLCSQGQIRRRDGEVRWAEFTGRRQKGSKEDALLVVGTMADITDRKRAELALYESRERLEKVISQAAAGVVQADFDGRITLANQKYCEMLGRTEAELIGTSLIDITAPDSIALTLDAVKQLAAGGSGFTIDKRYRRKDGSLLWTTTSVNALRTPHGRFWCK